MRTFQKFFGIILLSFVIFSACQENVSDPGLDNSNQVSLSKIVHRVSVGGCDIIIPPSEQKDRNFSLVATINSDEIVSGQWQDTFAGGVGSIHVAVDCLVIDGNSAIVGGVVTNGYLEGYGDLTGKRAVTAVLDGGEGNNADPDQISPSFIEGVNGTIGSCGEYILANFTLFDIQCGQVQVK